MRSKEEIQRQANEALNIVDKEELESLLIEVLLDIRDAIIDLKKKHLPFGKEKS